MNHVTIGVYANDSYKINVVKEEHLKDHIEYNKVFRYGRGLFVDGKCENQEYLTDIQVMEWEDKIKQMNIDTKVASKSYV